MRFRIRSTLLPTVLLCLLGGASLAAEDMPEPKTLLRVEFAGPSAPMVIFQEDGTITGFDAELWDMIAQDIGVNYEARLVPWSEKFAGLTAPVPTADLALGGFSITQDRERQVDFSHEYLNGPLAVLVPAEEGDIFEAGLERIVAAFVHVWKARGVFMAVLFEIIFAGLVMFTLERKIKGSHFSNNLHGLFDAQYWAMTTATSTGYGDKVPVSTSGKVLAMIQQIIGIGIIGTLLGVVGGAFFIEALHTDIQSPKDLAGKVVGTLENSTPVDALESYGAIVRTYPTNLEGAYADLRAGNLDAVVFDEPVLRYHLTHQGGSEHSAIATTFEPQSLAVALAPNSPYEEDINLALLRIKGDGRLDALYKKYFGEN